MCDIRVGEYKGDGEGGLALDVELSERRVHDLHAAHSLGEVNCHLQKMTIQMTSEETHYTLHPTHFPGERGDREREAREREERERENRERGHRERT